MNKRNLAEWHGYTVEVNGLSFLPGCVNVTTTDGTKPFTKYFYGAGTDMDNTGTVFIDSLENMRVSEDVADPFEPDSTEPEIEYEIPAWLDEQMDYAELRRGNA
jgi:hypothetical protein